MNNFLEEGDFDNDNFEEFIARYLIKHPSNIIIEKDQCWNLENSLRIKIDELEANGKGVVLREGDEVSANEFFVTQTNDGGQIWELIYINLTGNEVILKELEGPTTIVSLNNNSHGRFTLRSGQQAELEIYENYSIKVSWSPENVIDTFYDCQYDRKPLYIVIPDSPKENEINMAYNLSDILYQISSTHYGQIIVNKDMYEGNYDNFVAIGVKGEKTIVVMPQYTNEQDYRVAIEMDAYTTCPMINSSELVNRDIMQSFCIEQGSCESCGIIGPFFCSEERCLGLSEGCYFIDIPFGPNQCNPCSGLSCSNHLDESDCYLDTCNLDCEWQDNRCTEKKPLKVRLFFSTEKDVYDLNEKIRLTQGAA